MAAALPDPHATPDGDGLAVGRRLDALPAKRLHLLLFVLLGLGLLLDQMESSMTAVLAAVFSQPGSGVGATALATMIFFYYVVGSLGAPLFGALSDRIGRRRCLILAVAGFGLLAGVSALITDFNTFAIVRILSSIVLTAVPPLVYSYAADVLPASLRGRMIMLISVTAAIGGMLAPGLTHVANGIEPFGLDGWRTTMLGGGIAAVLVAIWFRSVPESPRWLAARRRPAEAELALRRFESSRSLTLPGGEGKAKARPLATAVEPDRPGGLLSPSYRRRLALVIVLNFIQSFALTGFAVLLTTSLVRKGFGMQDALGASSLILLAMPVGVLLTSVITDSMSRRTLYVAMSLVAAVSAMFFGYATATWALIGSGLLFSLVMAPYATMAQIYSAEMFPTRLRATALGFGYGALKIGSACVPLFLLPLLLRIGPVSAFTAIAVLLVIVGLIVRIFGPRIEPGSLLA